MNIISGVLFFVAFLPYIWTILIGETVPSPASWAIWATVDTIALLAMRKEKATSGQLTGAVAGAWIVTAMALIFGQSTFGLVEGFCIFGAIMGIILWQTTGNAVLAIISSQITVFIGAIPTFVGAYANPAQEDKLSWLLWTASCVCALFAIKKWNLANALQPLTFTTIETTMVVLVVIRPLFFS